VLCVAGRDDRVRAVCLNGSRVNPSIPPDIFQDFDVAYLVTDLAAFVADPDWIDVFGERLILQTPDAMGTPPSRRARFAYLMLFADGNRIDLTLVPLAEREAYVGEDRLTVVLLDKDGCLPALAPPSDEAYRVRRPSAAQFADCCNEFWWVSTYIAKGLWRGELPYAQAHLERYVRPMLDVMLGWRVGLDTGFSVSVGKHGKYLERYLPGPAWEAYRETYAHGTVEDVWRALLATTSLFRTTARSVAKRLGHPYPDGDDARVSAFLVHVHALPPTAPRVVP